MDNNTCGKDPKQRRDRGRGFVLYGVTEEEFVTHFVKFLEFSVDLGNCRSFRAYMEDMGETEEVARARSDPNSALAQRITAAIMANEALELVEAEYGRGAALKLDHPFNQTLIAHGHLAPERVDAARRRMALAEPT